MPAPIMVTEMAAGQQELAEFALACRDLGYTAFKIHGA